MSCSHSGVETRPTPFLKWPGGKRWLAPFIADQLQLRLKGTYYEPFLGGGAVFFELGPRKAVLGDINAKLIACYAALKSDPDTIIGRLRKCKRGAKFYYKFRDSIPRTGASIAAQMIYLSRTCWGGIYRVNQAGKFNVPFAYSGREFFDEQNIRHAAEALDCARLVACDFEPLISRAGQGDCIYVDPPYTTVGENNGFLRYNEKLFSWADQQRLAKACRAAANRGCFVVVSGLCHRAILGLYKNWTAVRVERMSTVSGTRNGRRRVHEIVIFSDPSLSIQASKLGKNRSVVQGESLWAHCG